MRCAWTLVCALAWLAHVQTVRAEGDTDAQAKAQHRLAKAKVELRKAEAELVKATAAAEQTDKDLQDARAVRTAALEALEVAKKKELDARAAVQTPAPAPAPTAATDTTAPAAPTPSVEASAVRLLQAAADEASEKFVEAAADASQAGTKLAVASARVEKAQFEVAAAEEAVEEAKPKPTGIDAYLAARCMSALCPHETKWLGIEPLVELPIAKSFAAGSGSLAQFINNHDIALQLAAGARVWFFRDLISLSVYLSVPLSNSSVRIEGSEFTYPGSSIRRPYPGIAVGLLYDIIWIGIDHDELRNGDSSNANAYNPELPANAVVSATTTISIALQPVTAVRALFGALAEDED